MCHPSPVLRNPADFADVSHATSLEFVVWFVPNLFAGAISVSFVGFFLGPIFPILMNHAGRILPPDCISGAIGWTGSWGAAGAAVFPFITGAISSKAGIGALPPVYVFMLGRNQNRSNDNVGFRLVAMAGILFVIWACVPATRQQLT